MSLAHRLCIGSYGFCCNTRQKNVLFAVIQRNWNCRAQEPGSNRTLFVSYLLASCNELELKEDGSRCFKMFKIFALVGESQRYISFCCNFLTSPLFSFTSIYMYILPQVSNLKAKLDSIMQER